MKSKVNQKKEEHVIHVCYLCGKTIEDEDYKYIRTRRKTDIWMHKRCVPKGRSEQNAACDR